MVPPSPNELRRKYRNVHAYQKLREAWERSLAYCVPSAAEQQALRHMASASRMRVKITVFNSRLYDPDNLIGSLKPVLDALKNVRFLKDDNADWLELAPVEQYRAKREQQQTVIDLEAAL
jgi:hypothetical protein